MAMKKISDFFYKNKTDLLLPNNARSSPPPSKKPKKDWEKYRSGVSETTFAKWKKEFPWLLKEENDEGCFVMYCSVCRQFGAKTLPGPGISSNGTVFSKGCKFFKHENVQRHDSSQVHAMSVEIAAANTKPQEAPILKTISRMDEQTTEKVKKLFNTAYHIAKQDNSFASFSPLVQLQLKNGLNMGDTYKNSHACATFVNYIAKDIQKNVLKDIIECDYFSFLCDGSTDVSTTETEIVYVHFIKDGNKKIAFLKLLELSSGTSGSIYKAITDYFDYVKIDYKSKLVSLCLDGTSVNFGAYKGIATRFSEACKGIVTIHCVAHRLELAIAESLNAEGSGFMKKCDLVLKGIYKIYNNSPKMLRQLKEIAEVYDATLLKHTNIIQTRWINARKRSIQSLCNNYETTVSHFEDYCATVGDSGNLVPKIKGYLQILKEYEFLEFMFFMLDLTNILSNLSLKMQLDDISIKQIMHKIHVCTSQLKQLKVFDNENLKMFRTLYDEKNNCFKSVQLKSSNSTRRTAMTKTAGYRSEIIDNILMNFNQRFGSLFDNPIFKNLDVFDPMLMPNNESDLLNYGLAEFDMIVNNIPECIKKNIDIEEAKKEYEVFKLWAINKRTVPFEVLLQRFFQESLLSGEHINLRRIFSFIQAVVSSTSICERGFSSMKLIKNDKRNKLMVSTVNDLLTIKLNGPSIETFDPTSSVNLWAGEAKTIRRPNLKD